MIAEARAAVPTARCQAILDCGAAPGLAIAALQAGAEAVVVDAADPVLDKLDDIARQCGARLIRQRPLASLDLGNVDDPVQSAVTFVMASRG